MNVAEGSIALITDLFRKYLRFQPAQGPAIPPARNLMVVTETRGPVRVKTETPSRSRIWTREEILILKKRAFGNFTNDQLAERVSHLEFHLNRYDNSLIKRRKQVEWQAVERHADEISVLMKRLSRR